MAKRIATFVQDGKLLTGREARKAWAAQSVSCNCGYPGEAKRSVSGTASDMPAEWLGCGNCSGQALGWPLIHRLPSQIRAKQQSMT